MFKKYRVPLTVLTAFCCLVTALVVGLTPDNSAAAASYWTNRETPVLVVTGSAVVKTPSTTNPDQESAVLASLSNEKAYTMAELNAMKQTERVFSTTNSSGTRKQNLITGVELPQLLKASGFDLAANQKVDVTFVSGSYKKTFTALGGTTRYSYPQQASGSDAGSFAISPMLALKSATSSDNTDAVPTKADQKTLDTPTLAIGAVSFDEMNNSSFIKELDTVQVGSALTANTINILGTNYTRAQLLMMERVTATYSYMTKAGEFVDTVRGIALADLVADLDDSEIVTISYLDGYTPTVVSVADIKNLEQRYMLALEKYQDGKWVAIYNIKNGYSGMGVIFNGKEGVQAGSGPASMIAGINVAGDDLVNSSYKHMTYVGTSAGATYAPDAITGATLTVEGPGVTATTPVLVSDLETTVVDNLYRGEYTDTRSGAKTTLQYEGVTVASIVQGLVNSNVALVSDDVQIVFKNRWRQDVCTIKYSDIVKAKTPVIMAYGTGSLDGETVAPFVYDGEPGLIKELGNDDGGLKLVFDAADFSGVKLPTEFCSVAYIYVEFTGKAPGYKHSEADDAAYSNVENTEFIVTMVGSALGREVNMTVADLEALVDYNSKGEPTGMGYRAEYGLSNTTYWYVNTYEGVKLWDLLVSLGLDASKYKNDTKTMITFASWDNYKTTAAFTMKQLADPNLFYFYEKSPSDIGTDRPTKAELALKENQPDNQKGTWSKDSNGYPVKIGFPVMLAYGVNGYPYVRNASMAGYYGGLGNDGGPVRAIFGKADGMNRDNVDDITNYAYFYNNGSNQMQRAAEIYVGEPIRYSTHTQNPAYKQMAGDTALTVDVVQESGAKETTTFTLAQIEDILYGEGIDKADRDNENRQEKAYYQYAAGKDALFEGVNLWYLLSESVGMQGSLGSASFYAGDKLIATIDLNELRQSGTNSLRGTSGLAAMVAFAKNGYPMVADASSAGYVGVDSATDISVENSGGPLAMVSPQYNNAAVSDKNYAANLTKIVVNLETDKYAHLDAYAAYGNQTIAFGGAVSNATSLKVSSIEKMQKYMVTDTYSVGGKTYTYRGIDLHALLNDAVVGASALAETITVTNATGQQTTLTASELAAGIAGKKVILAYGISADGKNALPLVPTTASAGYKAANSNSGGVMRLIINNGTVAQCVANVSSISVTAAEVTGWTHTYSYYADYLNTPVLRVTGDGVADPVTFTIGQLESLTNEMVLDSYKLVNNVYFQGVDLYKLLMNYVDLVDPATVPAFTVYAKDAYATAFKGSDLSGGINGKPMILAYGQGVSMTDGLPLVDENSSNGYDSLYDNAYGPIRLVVNDNSGWCVKWARCIVIGNGSFENPLDYADDLADIAVTVGGGSAPAPKPGTTTKPVVVPGGQYQVVPGDYLVKIAKTQLGDPMQWRTIYQLNSRIIFNPNLIYPGQILQLPQ